jgi:polyglutamine-binding protein 1
MFKLGVFFHIFLYIRLSIFKRNRYYYWNVETDQVSWLSPSHPRADIHNMSKSGADYAKRVLLEEDDDEEEEEDDDDEEGDDQEHDEEPVHEFSTNSRFEEDLDEFLSSYTSETDNKKASNQIKRQKKESPLDPMDPAAYSDIPR